MPLGDFKGFDKPDTKFPTSTGPGMGTANPGAYSGTSGPLFSHTPFGMPALEQYRDDYITQYIDPVYNAQEDALRNQAAIDFAGIDYSQQIFHRDNALAQQQLALQEEIARIQAGSQAGALADINTLEALARRRLGLTNQSLDVRQKGAGEQRITRDFENKSAGTARGAVFSAGTRNRTRDIGQAYDNELENIRIGREQAQTGFEQEMVGFQQARRNARTTQQIMDAQAEQFGLSRQELENALADGLAQYGIERQGAIDILADALNSNDAQRRAEGEQIMADLMFIQQVTGQTPQMYAWSRERNPEQPLTSTSRIGGVQA